MCPSAETILAVVEHPEAGRSNVAESVFRHLLHCRDCREVLTFVCAAVAFERDRKRQQALWRQFQAKMSNGLVSGNGGSDEEYFDAIAAEVPAALILQSAVENNDIHFWKATITFPEVDQTDAPLTIMVDDVKKTPIHNGTFVLFDIEIPIVDGIGKLTRTQLAECHHKGGAAFRWQDGSEISGAPVLNA